VKHFKDGNTDIADEPRCRRRKLLQLVDFFLEKWGTNSAARYVQTRNKLRRALH
jgi:hypothetical protein